MTASKIVEYSSDGSRSIRAGEYIPKAELNKIAERIRHRIRRSVQDIIDTGRDLIQVKQAMDHGEFIKWIDTEFSMTSRTAQRFMLAAKWVVGKNDTVSDLPPSVLYLLASPSTPPEVTDAVIAQAEEGQRVKAEEVRRQVEQAKAARAAATAEKALESDKHHHERESKDLEAEDQRHRVEVCDIFRKLPDEALTRLAELEQCWMASHFRASAEWSFVLGELRAKIEPRPDLTPPPSNVDHETSIEPSPSETSVDDPLAIPSQFKREPSDKKPPRKVSEDMRAKRAAHKIASDCRRLLEKDRKSKARKRRTAAQKKPADAPLQSIAGSLNKVLSQ